jgi:hypothetical protein
MGYICVSSSIAENARELEREKGKRAGGDNDGDDKL